MASEAEKAFAAGVLETAAEEKEAKIAELKKALQPAIDDFKLLLAKREGIDELHDIFGGQPKHGEWFVWEVGDKFKIFVESDKMEVLQSMLKDLGYESRAFYLGLVGDLTSALEIRKMKKIKATRS